MTSQSRRTSNRPLHIRILIPSISRLLRGRRRGRVIRRLRLLYRSRSRLWLTRSQFRLKRAIPPEQPSGKTGKSQSECAEDGTDCSTDDGGFWWCAPAAIVACAGAGDAGVDWRDCVGGDGEGYAGWVGVAVRWYYGACVARSVGRRYGGRRG